MGKLTKKTFSMPLPLPQPRSSNEPTHVVDTNDRERKQRGKKVWKVEKVGHRLIKKEGCMHEQGYRETPPASTALHPHGIPTPPRIELKHRLEKPSLVAKTNAASPLQPRSRLKVGSKPCQRVAQPIYLDITTPSIHSPLTSFPSTPPLSSSSLHHSSSDFSETITPFSLSSLLSPHTIIDDSIIMVLLRILIPQSPDILIVASITLDNDLSPRPSPKRQQLARSALRIFLPYHQPRAQHWVLYIYYPRLRRLEVYNSLAAHTESKCPIAIKRLLEMLLVGDMGMGMGMEEGKGGEVRRCVGIGEVEEMECPQQGNGVDCGVHVIWCAAKVGRGEVVGGMGEKMDVHTGELRKEYHRLLLARIDRKNGECIRRTGQRLLVDGHDGNDKNDDGAYWEGGAPGDLNWSPCSHRTGSSQLRLADVFLKQDALIIHRQEHRLAGTFLRNTIAMQEKWISRVPGVGSTSECCP
ncbi:MAG: hypothetical protein Q9166_008169 [cf. Caloplaca sp. 2 TL-2023]